MTNTSSPRTFSWISTNTSMSAKRRIEARVSGRFECGGDRLGERTIAVAGDDLHAAGSRVTPPSADGRAEGKGGRRNEREEAGRRGPSRPARTRAPCSPTGDPSSFTTQVVILHTKIGETACSDTAPRWWRLALPHSRRGSAWPARRKRSR